MVSPQLYSKEVNALVANARTAKTGRLTKIITANDLQGIDLFGDATFRTALSASSKKVRGCACAADVRLHLTSVTQL